MEYDGCGFLGRRWARKLLGFCHWIWRDAFCDVNVFEAIQLVTKERG